VLADRYDAIVTRWQMSLDEYGFDRFRAEFPTVDSRALMETAKLQQALGRTR
jgi:hypothetical protein